ncbi:MBOAT family protein [Flavobacteriales bacterium]|nr:MBOAT family protein [Flavobacteriales bacterium]
MSFFDLNPSQNFTFLAPQFWGFLVLVMVGLWASERKLRIRNAFLFFVSLLFYWKTNGWFVGILVFSTLVDWGIGWQIFRSQGTQRKLWLAGSIVANLGLLGFFKYAYFFADALNPMLGTQWNPHSALGQWSNANLGTTFRVDQILLPIGISFYTFQTLSYSIDVYRRQITPCRSPLDFGFFVSFFPQLVAGPIVRAKDFIPQLHQPYSLSRPEFGMALFWILNGLIKKIWLADYLAVNLVDRVFMNPGSFSGFENVLGLYAYSLQVYADFSGYTDMAIGIALLMGFRLPLNFRSPYKARSVGEFWQRWHISLSSWLKDYLYIPMGGNRTASTFTYVSLSAFTAFLFLMLPSAGVRLIAMGCILLVGACLVAFPGLRKQFNTNINLMMTMLLGGLWHGASWNFVLWGALNGLGLIFYKAWRRISPWEVKNRWWKHAIGMILTFHFISATRIWFRSGSQVKWNDLSQPHDLWAEWFTANTMLMQIINRFWASPFMEIILGNRNVVTIMLVGMAVHLLPEQLKARYRKGFAEAPLMLMFGMTLGAIGVAYLGMSSGLQPFIYFQF